MPSLSLRFLPLLALLWSASSPTLAQSEAGEFAQDEVIPLTPQALEDAMSCRSRAALGAFGSALFFDMKPPAWMREAKDDKQTEGMIGLYGYRLSKPVTLFGEPVEAAYFMGDWVVALWPRAKAMAFIAAQKLERAPIKVTEQYYRFIDPESGPMLGAFEPTGGAMAAMLERAFAGTPALSAKAEFLFVGCNYTPASLADFLDVAGQSEAILGSVTKDVSAAAGTEPR